MSCGFRRILDARYEKVREAGIVTSQAVLIAVGIDWDGRRQILSVEMANRESRSAWKDFLVALKARSLKGVELVVSDDHAGLVAAIGEVMPEAAWQRCYVHFLRNTLDHLPRKHWRRLPAGAALAVRSTRSHRGQGRSRRMACQMVGPLSAADDMGGGDHRTHAHLLLPAGQHHKHLKSTNMLERLNEEIRRRTYVVRIFPNAQSCLRLVRALAVETNENWMEANRYINMDDLREHKKLALHQAA
ncbi:hypothetical protein GCM10007880_64160 [Mesorhizobium amorphae]|uniref:IS256 family transposase n=1 Tax=Mesorhizobium amorphae TaxID=71433 RepID=UPI00235CE474|nr:hypothetical protein GCM10007880_64160 [Mesorhizobium amorphae]